MGKHKKSKLLEPESHALADAEQLDEDMELEEKAPGAAEGIPNLKIGQYVSQVEAVVMDLDDALDVILTETWLTKHKAVMDYSSQACMFTKRGKRFIVRCVKPRASSKSTHQQLHGPKILSVCQAKRALRSSRVWYCLALVQQVDETSEVKVITDPRVQALVDAYPTVFTDSPPYGGSNITSTVEAIPLEEGAKPINRPMFRYSPLEMAEMEKQIKDLLEKGYIEPSSSPFGAPVLFVKKPRSTELRLVIDYRALNRLTRRNSYSLPRIDLLLDMLAGATCYSSIDLRKAFHQVQLGYESDRIRSAFRTPFGHYQWRTLSMGLTNAPAVMQSVVNDIFRPYLGKFVVVYLDDICIFSKSEKEHAEHLKLVLDILEKHNLTVAWHKCHFYQQELLFVGHIVTAEGIKADPAKVAAVTQYPTPTDVHQLRSFLGMTGYFRRFIDKYAQKTHALTQLLKQGAEYIWGANQESAFESLKQALVSAPVLKLPDWQSDSPFEIVCDASYQGIGGMLQLDGHPVAFESRKLNKAELNYSATELEMLAVVHCIKAWRCYIEGKDVHVYTDHKPNVSFVTNPGMTRRQARWVEELQSYNIHWHYKPGAQNVVADALSRHPADSSKVLVASMINADRRRAQQLCTSGPFLAKVQEGYQQDSWFQETANIKALSLQDGIYLLGHAIVVPDFADLRSQVLHECHDAPYAGHPGRDKTLQLVQQMFWWPTVSADIRSYVKKCPSCQRNKSSNSKPAGLLKPLPVPGEPWESISMDMVVDLPQTADGFDSITVFVDRYTKMVHLAPCKKQDTARDIATLFVQKVFCMHGLPKHMVTDRDPKFTSVFWEEVFRYLEVDHSLTSAYHPQSDGNTERVNRVMEDMLRHYVDLEQSNWSKLLPVVEFAINNSYHESIKTTPFMANFGRTPRTPLKNVCKQYVPQRDAPAVKEFLTKLQEAQALAKRNLEAAQQRQKAYADRHRREVSFTVGQKVLLSTKNLAMKMVGSAKLLPKFIGPFEITGQVNEVAYRLALPECMRMHNVFHVSLLREWHDNGKYQPPPPPVILDGDLEYEVERVLHHREKVIGTKRTRHGKKKIMGREYLIKWLGYPAEYNTWEPEENCLNCPDMVQDYWDRYEAKAEAKLKQNKLAGRRHK
jgi:hypothetical protein